MSEPVVWPFAAAGDIIEQLEWLTDILPASTGPEQRNRLRDTPRTALTFNGLDAGDDRRWLENLLHSNGAGSWWVPWAMDGQLLVDVLPAATHRIDVDTRWSHFGVGERALLCGPTPRQFELVQIASIDDGGFETVAEIGRTWGAGTRVYPAFRARLQGMVDIPRFTADAGTYSATFRADAPIAWPEDAGSNSYRGLPVLELATDWSTDPTDVPERSLSTSESELSLPFVTDLIGRPINRIALSHTAVTAEETARLRSLLYALAGCWGAIWVPGRSQDLRVVGDAQPGSWSLDVAWSGIAGQPLRDNRRDIRIELFDGSVHYRRINTALEVAPDRERVTLDAPFSEGFSAWEVMQVSFLQLCRQDADVRQLQWLGAGIAQTTLGFRAEARHGL